MIRRLGCLLIYFLYIIIYFVYFILIAELLSNLPLGMPSDALLALSLFLSFVLAAMTSIIAMKWKTILGFVRSK